MKKFRKFVYVLAATTMAVVMPSCSDDDETYYYDIFPAEVVVSVSDAEGNDLLNPDVAGNIVGENVTMEYKNETFKVQWNSGNLSSNEPSANFYGMGHYQAISQGSSTPGNWYIQIGEFDNTKDFDITIPIKIKDSTYSIRVVNKVRNGKNYPEIETTVYLDGKECENNLVQIEI